MKKIFMFLTAIITASNALYFNIAASQDATDTQGNHNNRCEENKCLYGDCENGRGLLQMADCTKFWGRFTDGRFNGYGIITSGSGKLLKKGLWENGELTDTGQCTGNCINGEGTISYSDGSSYKGSFKNGMFHGQGRMTWEGGDSFEGKWENDDYSDGLFTYGDGSTYRGTFKMRYYNGKGVQVKYERKWDGEWKDGNPEGKLVYTDSYSNIKITGNWKKGELRGKCTIYQQNDRIEAEIYPLEEVYDPGGEKIIDLGGKGTWYYEDGSKYVGDIRTFFCCYGENFVRYGKGILYDKTGKMIRSGDFLEDYPGGDHGQ